MTGSLPERMKLIDENRGATYYERLITRSGGGLRSAAMVDLALDGELVHVDLRRAPFAGNYSLKELYRTAAEAQAALTAALLQLVWQTPEGDQ